MKSGHFRDQNGIMSRLCQVQTIGPYNIERGIISKTSHLKQSKEHWTLEGKALRDFSKSETKRDRKKSYKHYLYIPKKYTSLPNEKGVAQYLGLPRPI